MAVGIAAQWTKDNRELNGLNDIEEQLIENPHDRHFAVVEIGVKRVVRDVADGDTERPTVQIFQIEPLDGDAAKTAKELMTGAYKARTGKTAPPPQDALPFDEAAEGQGDGEPVSERSKDEWLDGKGGK